MRTPYSGSSRTLWITNKFFCMRLFRVDNLLFREILDISLSQNGWEKTIKYGTKHISTEFSAWDIEKTSDEASSLWLITNHHENYIITGKVELSRSRQTSVVFGVINILENAVIGTNHKMVKIPKGLYEIRTRKNRNDDYYSNERWEIVKTIVAERYQGFDKTEAFKEIYSTEDWCGSNSNATNVSHCDYYLYLYKSICVLLYHHDCNGRGSNGLEFDCVSLIYDIYKNADIDLKEVYNSFKSRFRIYDGFKIEVSASPQDFSCPDDSLFHFESILKSLSSRMLESDRIHAPQLIGLIIKGMFKLLEDNEYRNINEFTDVLTKLDRPLVQNLIIQGYGFDTFIDNAKILLSEKNEYGRIYKIERSHSFLALKKQDATFDISQIPNNLTNVTEATLWSFNLDLSEISEYDAISL
jgi:hypothetical protein